MAETGYELVGITSDDVEIIKQDDGTYTFTMPDNAVTITAEFKWIDKLPDDVKAEFQNEFKSDADSVPASWYFGTLKGQGLVYVPFVSVTVNHNESTVTKTAKSSTTISSGNISIAVVIDKAKDDVQSVMLSGLAADSQTSGNQTFTPTPENSSEEVE